MSHTNKESPCDGCEAILHRYPCVNPTLLSWVKHARLIAPELHVCQAGRGRRDQEAAFKAGKSKAHYGESAHSYNMAVDVFRLLPNGDADFSETWYQTTLAPLVAQVPELDWSGNWHGFKELDHVEIKHWHYLVSQYPEKYALVDGPLEPAPATSKP